MGDGTQFLVVFSMVLFLGCDHSANNTHRQTAQPARANFSEFVDAELEEQSQKGNTALVLSPKSVCEKIADLAVDTAGFDDAEIVAKFVGECRSELRVELNYREVSTWNAYAQCVLETSTPDDLSRCDAEYPFRVEKE